MFCFLVIDLCFDVLFFDINMFGKNGYDCFKEMKLFLYFENVLVVVFIILEVVYSVKVVYDYGVVYFIMKFFDFG